jgi:Ca2+-binding RTX toxin-like protein
MKRALAGFAVIAVAFGVAASLVMPVTAGAATSSPCGEQPTVVGTEGNDVLRGTPERDVIDGMGGDDTIFGQAGDDLICGGDGADLIHGGADRDVAYGGFGDDRIRGGDRPDFLYGEDGNDDLTDDAPDPGSLVSGGPGDDVFHGGEVWYITSPQAVHIDLAGGTATGEGNDTLVDVHKVHGSPFDDRLIGSNGEDRLMGESGNDVILGGRGDDDLIGDVQNGGQYTVQGDDQLFGEAGADVLRGDSGYSSRPPFGDDVLDGGIGTDIANHWGTDYRMVIDLELHGAVGEGADRLLNLENITGSYNASNIVRGDEGPNRLDGGFESDVIVGRDGDDLVRGDWGKDKIRLGNGDDRIWQDTCELEEDITLDGGAGSDDVVFNGIGCGGITVDLASGYFRGREIDGRLANIENARGTWWSDTIYGSDGANELRGSAGNDGLYGRGGDDFLGGGGGRDVLDGGEGTDNCHYGEHMSGCP